MLLIYMIGALLGLVMSIMLFPLIKHSIYPIWKFYEPITKLVVTILLMVVILIIGIMMYPFTSYILYILY